MLDAIHERQQSRLQLGRYPCSLVDQALQLRKAGMARVGLIVNQIRMVPLLEDSGTQQRHQFAAQTARAQAAQARNLPKVELPLRLGEEDREEPRSGAPEEQLR